MADWGTPPGMIDNDIRSDSPSNDMRAAQLERRRQLLKQKEKKKRQQQLGPIGRNEISSGRRREAKAPLVSDIADPNELGSRYAYDGPEAYNEHSYQVNNPDKSKTTVQIVNVATPDLEDYSGPESIEDADSAAVSTPPPPPQLAPEPLPLPQETKRERKKKERAQERKQEKAEQQQQQQQQKMLSQSQPMSFSDDEDDLETAVIPASSAKEAVSLITTIIYGYSSY